MNSGYTCGLGSGPNGEFTFLDILAILSFCISMMNLNENLSQGDKQDLQKDLADKADVLLSEIHGHLKEQDRKIDRILEVLSNDSRTNI